MSTATISSFSETTSVTADGASCANCGVPQTIPDTAKLRISDLEAQVKLLSGKAAAAVDRLADYEDEIRFYRQQRLGNPSTPPISISSDPRLASPPPEPHQHPQAPLPTPSRFSSFLPINLARKASPSNSQPPTPGIPPHYLSLGQQHPTYASHSTSHSQDQAQQLAQLQAALLRERQSREEAEARLNQSGAELEELTAQLFGQANEMVAQERRARAKLEERVEMLEKRDGERGRRLERLERAVGRIERVKGLVNAA